MLRQLPPTTLETPNTSIHAHFWGFVFWLATMTTTTTHHLPPLLKRKAEHHQPLETGPLLATMITNAYLNHEMEGWNLSTHETFLAAIITRNARLRSDHCATTASSIPKPQRPAFVFRILTSGHHRPSSPSTLMEGGRFLATTALPLFETWYGRHPPVSTMSANELKCLFLGLVLVHYLSMSILEV